VFDDVADMADEDDIARLLLAEDPVHLIGQHVRMTLDVTLRVGQQDERELLQAARPGQGGGRRQRRAGRPQDDPNQDR